MARSLSGDALRRARLARKLSQEQIARHSGISRVRVTVIEQSRRPTDRVIARYVAALMAASEAER